MSNGKSNEPNVSAVAQGPATHSAFVPLLLTLIAFLMILGWTLGVTIRQASNLQNVKFQIWQASAQSVQAEEKLKAMLSDLVDLAADDPAAAVIVKRYKIKQNAAAAETPEGRGQKSEVKSGEKPAAKKTVAEPAAPVEDTTGADEK